MASADPKEDRKTGRLGGRISLQTLIIASIASAAASFAASRIWGGGTIVSAAATPVIVALVSEFLRRPVETVAQTAKKVPTVQTLPAVKRIIAAPANIVHPSEQSTDTAPAPPAEEPGATTPAVAPTTPPPAEEPGASTPTTPPPAEERGASTPTTPPPAEEPSATASTAEKWRPRWRLAIATGLLAFAIVVAIYTVPDLLAGRSITGNGQPTTFFGATSTVGKKSTSTTTTVTTTAPTTTVTKTSPTTTVTKSASKSTTSTSTSTGTSTSTTSATKPPAPAGAQTTTTSTTSSTPAP